MINYRVEDLHALVDMLKGEGCNVLDKIDESEYGKFAWVIDPEGKKLNFGSHQPTNKPLTLKLESAGPEALGTKIAPQIYYLQWH